MTSQQQPAPGGLIARLWIYQRERFPLLKTVIMVAFFTTATLSVSAQLAGRELPGLHVFAAIWISVSIIFFQMRACDEMKDLEIDRRYQPERPIPRGLVSLKLILSLALGLSIIALAATLTVSTSLLVFLVLVWFWLAIMTYEFFVPEWLKKRPFIYLVSHMAIMPLIDLYISAGEWLSPSGHPPSGLWVFLCLSFVNGCILEFGRKIRAPENERDGVDTYSGLLGYKSAAKWWVVFCILSTALLIYMGYLLSAAIWVSVPIFLALFLVFGLARRFSATPSTKLQDRIETYSGVWVLLCYALAGFLPLLIGKIGL